MTHTDQKQKDSESEENFWQELSLLLRLWPFLKSKAWILLIAIALTPIITSLQLFQPYILKIAIDEHILTGEIDGLLSLGIQYLLVAVGAYVITAIYTIALAYVGQSMLKELRLFLVQYIPY